MRRPKVCQILGPPPDGQQNISISAFTLYPRTVWGVQWIHPFMYAHVCSCIRGSCTHRARTASVQSFDICVFIGTAFSPLPSSKEQDTSGKHQYASAVECSLKTWEQESPCKAERNTRHPPEASGNHPQAFGNTRQTGLQWASSSGKISRNIRKVPHRARTVRQHPLSRLLQLQSPASGVAL